MCAILTLRSPHENRSYHSRRPVGGGAPAHAAVTLRSGHADFGARIVGGTLQSPGQGRHRRSGKVTWRDPSDVVVALGSQARVTSCRTVRTSAFSARPGTRIWLIPQTQRSGVIWLGWNTESLSSRQVRGSVAWTLERVSGPGRVVVFQTGSFGAADVLFDSRRSRPGTRNVPLGVHAHGNWAFTRAGTYKLRFRMSATSRAGRSLSDVVDADRPGRLSVRVALLAALVLVTGRLRRRRPGSRARTTGCRWSRRRACCATWCEQVGGDRVNVGEPGARRRRPARLRADACATCATWSTPTSRSATTCCSSSTTSSRRSTPTCATASRTSRWPRTRSSTRPRSSRWSRTSNLDTIWLGLRARGDGARYGADRVQRRAALGGRRPPGPGDGLRLSDRARSATPSVYFDSSDGFDAADGYQRRHRDAAGRRAHAHVAGCSPSPASTRLTFAASLQRRRRRRGPVPLGEATFTFAVGRAPARAGRGRVLDRGHADLTADLDRGRAVALYDPEGGGEHTQDAYDAATTS